MLRIKTSMLEKRKYADDLILLAPSAEALQIMLDALNVWCDVNKMTVNGEHSNVIHF